MSSEDVLFDLEFYRINGGGGWLDGGGGQAEAGAGRPHTPGVPYIVRAANTPELFPFAVTSLLVFRECIRLGVKTFNLVKILWNYQDLWAQCRAAVQHRLGHLSLKLRDSCIAAPCSGS